MILTCNCPLCIHLTTPEAIPCAVTLQVFLLLSLLMLGMLLLCLLTSLSPWEETWPCHYTPNVWFMPARSCRYPCGFGLVRFFPASPLFMSLFHAAMILE